MPLRIAQRSTYKDDDWWEWSVHIEGPALDDVKYVEYTLHETFPQPVRRIENRNTNFELALAGWGGFTIYARVKFRDNSEEQLEHELELYYPSGEKTKA